MSKRLMNIADELGMSADDLLERLRAQGFPIPSKGRMAVMTDKQEAHIRSLLDDADADASAEEKVVKQGVIRRRTSRRGGDDTDSADTEPVASSPPVLRRKRSKVAATEEPLAATAETPTPAAEPAPEPPVVEEIVAVTEVSAEPAEEVAPARQSRFATLVTRTEPIVETPDVVEAAAVVSDEAASTPEDIATVSESTLAAPTEVAAADPDAEPVARKQARFAHVVTREFVAVPEGVIEGEPTVDAADEPVKERRRFETVVTGTGADTPSAPSPLEMMALARKEADARAQIQGARTGGARVVGALSQEELTGRMESGQRSDFIPQRGRAIPGTEARGPSEDRKTRGKKGAKRVVQSRDLYDRGRRGGGKKRKSSQPAQQTRVTVAAEHKRVVRMEEGITIGELASQMSVKAGEVAMKLMFDLGVKGANINTVIDYDTAHLLAELYQFKVEQIGFDINKYLPTYSDNEDDYRPRPPIVTVMGHVDHGKTSVLDAVRKSHIADGEAGGITQHIGAYMVHSESGAVCFLDTPGHEAFTALRARGARATDIVVLVVAADDGVMPQTVEAINHARDAEVPIIVAVNKIDKPGANVDRVKQALTEYQLVPEEWGGDTLYVETSALTGQGIDTLVETIHLQSEVMELIANPNRMAEGLVIESKLDVGRGPVATVLVQEGTFKQGDIVVVGQYYGRVRTMSDERGTRLEEAEPSTPVEITGLNGVPPSGEQFYVVREERAAKAIADHIEKLNKQSEMAQSVAVGGGMEGMTEFIRAGLMKELKVIIKGDVQGSVEALATSLQNLSTEEVRVRIVHSGVGSITENDINLAASSAEDVGVVVIGFNVKPDNRAQAHAEQYGVLVVTQSIIYEIIDRVRALMTGLLEPVYIEEMLGTASVRATFQIPRVGTVAGCMVLSGHLERNARARLMRNGEVIHESNISSLRHFEKDVKEVKSGFECGVSIDRYNDIHVDDVIECYKLRETAATL